MVIYPVHKLFNYWRPEKALLDIGILHGTWNIPSRPVICPNDEQIQCAKPWLP